MYYAISNFSIDQRFSNFLTFYRSMVDLLYKFFGEKSKTTITQSIYNAMRNSKSFYKKQVVLNKAN